MIPPMTMQELKDKALALRNAIYVREGRGERRAAEGFKSQLDEIHREIEHRERAMDKGNWPASTR